MALKASFLKTIVITIVSGHTLPFWIHTSVSALQAALPPWRSQNGACDLEGHTPWRAFSALIDKSEFSVASRRRDSRSWSPLIPGGRRNVRNCRHTDTLCLGWCLGTRGARPSLRLAATRDLTWPLSLPGIKALAATSEGPLPNSRGADHSLSHLPWPHLLPPTKDANSAQSWGLLEAYMLLLGS